MREMVLNPASLTDHSRIQALDHLKELVTGNGEVSFQ